MGRSESARRAEQRSTRRSAVDRAQQRMGSARSAAKKILGAVWDVGEWGMGYGEDETTHTHTKQHHIFICYAFAMLYVFLLLMICH